MPAMKKLKLSIAAKISQAWPAPTVLFYLTVSSEAGAWEPGVGRNKAFRAQARISVSGIRSSAPETPPRATLG